jgi:hypothetical protein
VLCVCVRAGVFGLFVWLCRIVMLRVLILFFLLNGMKRSSPAFSRKKFNHLDIHFIEYK